MATVLLTIVVMLLAVAGMAVGVLMGRAPIKGSCGGMSALAGGGTCSVCGDDPSKCTEPSKRSSARDDEASGGVRQFDPRNS